MKFCPLSPLLSQAYMTVAVFAYFVFREDLNVWRISGIAFICADTVLIAQSERRHGAQVAIAAKISKTSELIR